MSGPSEMAPPYLLRLSDTLTRRGWIVSTLLLPAVLLVAPVLGLGLVGQSDIEVIVLISLPVSGLNLCYGYAGELALGQVAVYAAGAYLGGYISIHLTSNLLVGILAGAVAGPVIGLLTGIPGLRLSGWSLAMVSFFLVLIVPNVVSLLGHYTGGLEGLTGLPSPTLFGHALSQRELYITMVVVAAIWFAIFRNLIFSRYGRGLLVIRESSVLGGAVGLSVFRSKLAAYMTGAVPAGVAGALLAAQDQFVTPDYFSFSLGVAFLAATVLGGRTSIYGAVIGASLLELGPLRPGSFQSYDFVVYGVFLLIGGAVLPGGLIGAAKSYLQRQGLSMNVLPAIDIEAPPPLALAGRPLEVREVTKSFDGVLALDGVSLVAQPGRVTSIIGPNGSGKTTLLNLMNGFHHPSTGTVTLGGQRIERLSAAQIARLGVARTFQTPIVSSDLSVLDTAALGRIGRDRVSMFSVILRLPRYRRTARRDTTLATDALRRVGIGAAALLPGSSLPLGHRRLLEMARALTAEPAVILLDEVASGVDEGAVAELAVLVRQLANAGATVVLVEHNFRLVLDVSDEIFVLANGKVIASGTPADIANHPDVLERYLGTTPPVVPL